MSREKREERGEEKESARRGVEGPAEQGEVDLIRC